MLREFRDDAVDLASEVSAWHAVGDATEVGRNDGPPIDAYLPRARFVSEERKNSSTLPANSRRHAKPSRTRAAEGGASAGEAPPGSDDDTTGQASPAALASLERAKKP